MGCKITEQEREREMGKAGAVLVEDPGELEEGVFGPQRETSEDKMESAEMECVVTR